jgi:hypothetical protein
MSASNVRPMSTFMSEAIAQACRRRGGEVPVAA